MRLNRRIQTLHENFRFLNVHLKTPRQWHSYGGVEQSTYREASLQNTRGPSPLEPFLAGQAIQSCTCFLFHAHGHQGVPSENNNSPRNYY